MGKEVKQKKKEREYRGVGEVRAEQKEGSSEREEKRKRGCLDNRENKVVITLLFL